jgi:hypothetical protein
VDGRDITAIAEDMLADAYEYVLSGWCQGAASEDECGRAIEPWSAFARKWSALGALERAWQRSPEDPGLARHAFDRARLALIAAVNDLPQSWNDDPGRDQSHVLSALAEAVQLVASAPGAQGREPILVETPLEELFDDVDAIAHRWSLSDVVFGAAGDDPAHGAARVENPLGP